MEDLIFNFKNILWNYGGEGFKISGLTAIIGSILTAALGGWDAPLYLLVSLMAVDFVLGTLQAIKAGKLDSKVMFWGGVNKILVLLLVAVANRLDATLPLDSPYIRTAIIFFYCGREGLSLVENYGKMGMPLPAFIVKILEQLKEDGEKGGTK